MLDYNQQNNWKPITGKQQSPIDLDSNVMHQVNDHLPLKLETPYHLTFDTDDETTIKVLGTGKALLFDRSFTFTQLHFHHPSEHSINGQLAPAEIHLVHENDIGQLAVVGLLLSLGDPDPILDMIMTQFKSGTKVAIDTDIKNWLPAACDGYHYLGSLTTPPLTEGVEWLIITNHMVTISSEQLKWLQTHFASNERVVQALNGRQVFHYGNV